MTATTASRKSGIGAGQAGKNIVKSVGWCSFPRTGRPRSQGRPLRSAPFLGARASCPLQHTGGPSAGRPLPASGRVRAGRPRSQGQPLRSAPSPGPRASCPLEHTGGPSAGRPLPASGRVRAGRPRSQGRPLRSASFPGSRAARPLEHTGGPSAGRPLPASGRVRAGRPRSQGRPLRSAPFPGSRASCPQRAGGPRLSMRARCPRSREQSHCEPGFLHAAGGQPSQARFEEMKGK